MTPEQLAEAHTTVIRKHYRKLEDHPGRVHAELLADLAYIADEHAADRVAADGVTGDPEAPQSAVPPPARTRGSTTPRRAAARR